MTMQSLALALVRILRQKRPRRGAGYDARLEVTGLPHPIGGIVVLAWPARAFAMGVISLIILMRGILLVTIPTEDSPGDYPLLPTIPFLRCTPARMMKKGGVRRRLVDFASTGQDISQAASRMSLGSPKTSSWLECPAPRRDAVATGSVLISEWWTKATRAVSPPRQRCAARDNGR